MATSPRTTPAATRREATRQRDLRVMLQQRQSELLGVLRQRIQGATTRPVGEGLDEGEHAEVDTQDHLEVALIQMKGETILRLREALARVETGDYGDCAECGEEIAEPRLKALPFALRCLPCEQMHEQRAARERRPGSSQMFPLVFAEPAGL